MFTSTKTRSASTTANKPRRLNLESLESRQMMIATHLVLDFTPDYRTGSLWETFQNSRYTNGTSPSFLDFNGDRRITTQDADLAAASIRNTVASFFTGAARGYNVSVVYNDAVQQSNFGYRYLDFGLKSANDQVQVMYVGGRNQGEWGRAPMANNGYNVEGYGQTYAQSIATNLMGRTGMTKEHFVWAVSATAAHEFGHMLGLRHSRNVYPNDLMNPARSNTPWTSVFSTVNQTTENGTVQNSVGELRSSFNGQPTYYQNYNGGARQLAPGGELVDHAHDHDHAEHNEAGETCDLDFDAVMAGFENHAADDHDHDHADVGIDSLALLLSGHSEKPATSVASSIGRSTEQALSSPAKSDLLTLLANELENSTSQKPTSGAATAKAAATQQLDELFTDFGMVTAK